MNTTQQHFRFRQSHFSMHPRTAPIRGFENGEIQVEWLSVKDLIGVEGQSPDLFEENKDLSFLIEIYIA